MHRGTGKPDLDTPERSRSRRWRRRLLVGSGVLVAILFLLVLAVWLALVASLPRLEGEVALAGLSAPVTAERDDLGVPRIRADSLEDAVRAQGYLDAQERFFQMDLARRFAAGELAALVGPAALSVDRDMRPHRFRRLARHVLQDLPERHRRLIDAYAAGARAGLADLRLPPPEYLLLRATPEPWTDEDTILAVYTMFRGLNFSDRYEKVADTLFAALPEEMARFLTPGRSRFDTPVIPADERFEPAPIPGPEVVDLRNRQPLEPEQDALSLVAPPDPPYGSNAWVVSGARTSDGRAILANDMHLGLSVPNVWRRVQLEWTDANSQPRRAAGVSLPGVPLVVAGSTDRVAWGYTNSYADLQDYVIIEEDPNDPTRYRTPDGFEPHEEITETLEVRGGEDVAHTWRVTRWGPIVEEDAQGRPLALRWIAHDRDAFNLRLFDILDAQNVDEALTIAAEWRGPSQNIMLADAEGRIGWTISGALPARRGFEGVRPRSWADGSIGWTDEPVDDVRPALSSADGVLITANSRTVPSAWAATYGQVWAPPLRAARIEDLTKGTSAPLDETACLAIQLDVRSPVHDVYRDLALEAVPADESDALLARARGVLAAWSGGAAAADPAFALLRAFRDALHERVLAPIVAPCQEFDESFRYRWTMTEEPVRRILEQRPAHLLPPGHSDWTAFIRSALSTVARDMELDGGLARPWGEINRARIAHPAALAFAPLGALLNMPAHPQAGDRSTVRVSGASYGASQRTVVSPGHLEDAILHMPAGQSGHFLSDDYADSHPLWAAGAPAPLLAAEPRHTLRFVPGP